MQIPATILQRCTRWITKKVPLANSSRRVMIIDDVPQTLQTMLRILHGAGRKGRGYTNVPEAVRELAASPTGFTHVLISEHLTGELAAAIQNHRDRVQTHAILVILRSGRDHDANSHGGSSRKTITRPRSAEEMHTVLVAHAPLESRSSAAVVVA